MAQNSAPAARIVNPIDESQRVTLAGTMHPLANAKNDRGAAPDSTQLDRIHMVLKRSASQDAALKKLLGEMHTPGTASYHKWLTPVFDLDNAALEKRYFEAQRKFHPDKLAEQNAALRRQAIMQSIEANQAYETLKSPLKRAQHLLAINGITVGSGQDSVKPSATLLMETMELRELLADAETMQAVEKLDTHSKLTTENSIKRISLLMNNKDWGNAAQETLRLGYLLKFNDDIRIKKKGSKP